MAPDNKDIDQLLKKLNKLVQKQEHFQKEINQLKQQISTLQTGKSPTKSKTPGPPAIATKNNLEKFIGENLINKIGIIITIIGVGIGAKYSIEHQLISPLARIILGYLFGLGLLGLGIWLRKNYENYSAVLISGAMAILYFITFAAYDFYGIIGQLPSFLLMVAFTIFTVIAALNYNRQVIAIIGLVGSYAVPFLLGDGSGHFVVLLSYISIINAGILTIAFKKYWKLLFYLAFALTWLIFLTWYVVSFEPHNHLAEGLMFCTLFFIIFYVSFLAYKLIRKEKYNKADIVLLLANSFIYFAFGYGILDNHDIAHRFLGLFSLGNALMHFIVTIIVYRKKLADQNLFYFVSGLALVFITIAIPVELDGNWVTLLWAGEAALLFRIGRTKNAVIYEQLSYPLMVLAFISLGHDWLGRNITPDYYPVFNIEFLSSLIFIAAFAIINRINLQEKYRSKPALGGAVAKIFSFIIPGIFILSAYCTFLLEVDNFFNQQYANSLIEVKLNPNGPITSFHDHDILKFKAIWMINYTLLFLSMLSVINIYKLKSEDLKYVNLASGLIVVVLFLAVGLIALGMLRESYLERHPGQYYDRGTINLYIRYISFGFLALLLFAGARQVNQPSSTTTIKVTYELVLHLTMVWIFSSELFHWMEIFALKNIYKLGLSILWGVYALFLVISGIRKMKKYLRIVGISLFAITLCKLFLYDIAHLNTIKKTIVFVSLGILLLIISFLYNKFRDKIGESEGESA